MEKERVRKWERERKQNKRKREIRTEMESGVW